jgi:PilZ domain
MEERRKTERIQTHLHAQWETHSGVLEGTITNYSVHGCFVEAEVEEPGSEPVKLTVRLPNGTLIELWGTVAFHLPTMGFGLHFTDHAHEDWLNAWRKFLEPQKASDLVSVESSITTAA